MLQLLFLLLINVKFRLDNSGLTATKTKIKRITVLARNPCCKKKECEYLKYFFERVQTRSEFALQKEIV